MALPYYFFKVFVFQGKKHRKGKKEKDEKGHNDKDLEELDKKKKETKTKSQCESKFVTSVLA